MSVTGGGTCWNRCFLCSSPVVVVGGLKERRNGRKGVVVVEQELDGSVKLVMKYLLQDVGLESPLSVNVMSQWRGEEEKDGGGGFNAKLCTYCVVQVKSLTSLQLELEVIQMKIVSRLEGLKKAVISNSRLYGLNEEVKQDFDEVEEKMSQLEGDGRECTRSRKFLETIHHFQTFIFESENKTAHIPLVYLEKFTGRKMPVALSRGLNLGTVLLPTGIIKGEPQEEDYSEPMEEAEGDLISYDFEPSSPFLQAKIEDETPDSPTRRPSRKSAQLASARFKPVKMKPTKTKHPSKQLSQAHLLHLRIQRETRAKRKAGRGRRSNKPQTRRVHPDKHFKCDECGFKYANSGGGGKISKWEHHLKKHETGSEERNYECPDPDCKLGFRQKQYFELHLSYHARTRDCEICRERVILTQMESHLKTHQDKVFGCPHCSMWFATFENVVAHLKYHVNISVECGLCPEEESSSSLSSKQYSTRGELCRHLFDCHGKSEYKLECPVDGCSQEFYDETGLYNHQITHTGLHKCTACNNKSFRTNVDLDCHIRKEHPDQVKSWYYCDAPTCLEEKFLTERQLDRHKMLKHGKPKLKCGMCSEEFFNKTSLRHHGRVKHGLGKKLPNLVCTICGLQLSSKKRLKTHEATHNREKNFTCEICGFATKADEFLQRHKRIHKVDRERKFACPHCPDSFYNGDALKNHVRRHTGDRPFQCEDCGSAFSQLAALNVHKKKHLEGNEFVGRGPRATTAGRKGKMETADFDEGPSTSQNFRIQDYIHPAAIPPPCISPSSNS